MRNRAVVLLIRSAAVESYGARVPSAVTMWSPYRAPTAMGLLVDCATLYARTNDQGKRLANQALTNGIDISEDERATIRLSEPLAALTPKPTSTDVRSSSTSSLVDVKGLEPLTFRV